MYIYNENNIYNFKYNEYKKHGQSAQFSFEINYAVFFKFFIWIFCWSVYSMYRAVYNYSISNLDQNVITFNTIHVYIYTSYGTLQCFPQNQWWNVSYF